MSEAKWIPGPYAVDQVVSDEGDLDIILGYDVPGEGTPILIGTVLAGDDGKPFDLKQAVATARLWAAAPDLAESIRDQIAWIERLLQELTHHDVRNARGDVVNGFAGAIVPDWDLRQKLDGLKEDLALAEKG